MSCSSDRHLFWIYCQPQHFQFCDSQIRICLGLGWGHQVQFSSWALSLRSLDFQFPQSKWSLQSLGALFVMLWCECAVWPCSKNNVCRRWCDFRNPGNWKTLDTLGARKSTVVSYGLFFCTVMPESRRLSPLLCPCTVLKVQLWVRMIWFASLFSHYPIKKEASKKGFMVWILITRNGFVTPIKPPFSKVCVASLKDFPALN